MKFDLHMHSAYSPDGQLTCKELVDMAKSKGLGCIALTDHDRTTGVKEIEQIAKENGLQLVRGIECTTDCEGQDVHLLGYGIDPDAEYFQTLGAKLDKISDDAFGERVDKLEAKYGIHVDREAVLKKAAGKNPWFTLIDTILLDPIIQAHPDFQPYLPGGSRCDPAPVNFYWDCCMPGSDLYVEVPQPDFYASVEEVLKAGGTPVIAHPFKTFFHREDLLQRAVDAGVQGIEVYSNYHTPEQIEWYLQYAKDHNLLITCGSDFHGEKKPSIVMGEYHLGDDDTDYLTPLLQRIEENRNAWQKKQAQK
jgi:predicted metal-dependent phosphoesterase TrpH